MFPVLLWIMPLLMAVAVVIYVERVKRMAGSFKEESSFHYIFDSVAHKLEHMVDKKQIEEWVAQEVLQTLINELVDNGWYTADSAMFHHEDVPFIKQAFENCDIKIVE